MADDMDGLYKKIVKGYYQKIPTHYSIDLSNIIRVLLQVSPHLRPSCGIFINFLLCQRLKDIAMISIEKSNSLE